MLRMVAFHLNLRWFQKKPTRSSRTRLPALGALGCMSVAGRSRREDRQANHVTSAVPASEIPNTASASHQLNP